MDIELIRTAGGKRPADMAVVNGQLVNVYSGEILPGGVAVTNGRIAAVGDVDYTIGENTVVIDAQGDYITPGFIDGHIHPESSSLALQPLAQILLQHGTTAIMTDLHECGVVAGLPAIEALLEEVKQTDLKLYFVVPSHVPFSPNLETSGGHFDVEIIRKALLREDAVGLSECVCTYVDAEYDQLLQSIDDTVAMHKSVQGHMPAVTHPQLMECLAAGLNTDHEAFDGADAIARLRAGCHVMIREGSVARSLKDCLQPILDAGMDTSRVSIITDDLHTVDVVRRGHMDDIVRTMLSMGVPLCKAIQMVTLNAARAFDLDKEVGGLAPGRRADINIVAREGEFRVRKVVAGGKVVAEDGVFLHPYKPAAHAPCLLNTARLKHPITPGSFRYEVAKDAKAVKVHVIQTKDWIPVTDDRHAVLPVRDGVVQCDPDSDVLYVAQVERYGINGNVGKAFMGGFRLKEGAIASSVGHDNHNIIVLGANHEDMALAVNRVVELGGGQVAVNGGEIIGEVAYPILGLLSDMNAEELAQRKEKLIAAIQDMGCVIKMPFMFLSFLCLAAGGGYAITDHGFIDSAHQCVADPVIETYYE